MGNPTWKPCGWNRNCTTARQLDALVDSGEMREYTQHAELYVAALSREPEVFSSRWPELPVLALEAMRSEVWTDKILQWPETETLKGGQK